MRNVFIAAIILLTGMPPAWAAPFCIEQQGLPSECWYYDVQSCRKEATKRNGRCSANADEIVLPENAAPFCIIEAGAAPACVFQSGESCDDEAAARNAVCFQNIKDEESVDPYRFDRPLFRDQ